VVSCQVSTATSGRPERVGVREPPAQGARAARRAVDPDDDAGRQHGGRAVRHDRDGRGRPGQAVRRHRAEDRADEAPGERGLPVPAQDQRVSSGRRPDEDRRRLALDRAGLHLHGRGVRRPTRERALHLVRHGAVGGVGDLWGASGTVNSLVTGPHVQACTTSIRDPRRGRRLERPVERRVRCR
jgi:hypothetical protein